jgi:hypothetical protein
MKNFNGEFFEMLEMMMSLLKYSIIHPLLGMTMISLYQSSQRNIRRSQQALGLAMLLLLVLLYSLGVWLIDIDLSLIPLLV